MTGYCGKSCQKKGGKKKEKKRLVGLTRDVVFSMKEKGVGGGGWNFMEREGGEEG